MIKTEAKIIKIKKVSILTNEFTLFIFRFIYYANYRFFISKEQLDSHGYH